MSDPNNKIPSVAEALEQEMAKHLQVPLKSVVEAAATHGPDGLRRKRQRIVFALSDSESASEQIQIPVSAPTSESTSGGTLAKSVVNTTEDIRRGKEVSRLAFEEDPTAPNHYQSLWKPKRYLLPDYVLKQIGMRDSLVAAILMSRCNHVAAFGRELHDRFSTGYRIEPRRGIMADANPEQKKMLQERIKAASKLMATCGSNAGVDARDHMSLSDFLYQQVRNGLLMGRFATEVIYTRDSDGGRTFHSFRPVDAGTVYPAAPGRTGPADQVREQALHLLEQLRGPDADKLKAEKFRNDEYAWVQVIDGRPRQAFTPEEMVVYNLYSVTDIEMRGFPITPIDTAYDAIMTHMNITQHNKLYFQSGRAARGMVVIKSSDVDQSLVSEIRRHFNASINSVSNSWRVPTFGIDPDDDIEWVPLDGGSGRDMEFQYLSDSNAREICAAFLISPEEIPGYQHLSRGTNNQALSESNNEYKLVAARDIGIRPLLNHFQDFLNKKILPLVDPIVAQLCIIKLYGIDADTAEKEDTRISTAMAIDLTMDDILEKKEKTPLGATWGGTYPLNPGWQAVADKFIPVGKTIEHFFGVKGASQDPNLAYYRDPFWFQYQQLQLQVQQLQMQAQQMQTQAMAGDDQQEQEEPQGDGQEPESELATGADQVMGALGKSEGQLHPNKRRLLALHKNIVTKTMDAWEKDSKETLAKIKAALK
jgi:hypothetical protein